MIAALLTKPLESVKIRQLSQDIGLEQFGLLITRLSASVIVEEEMLECSND